MQTKYKRRNEYMRANGVDPLVYYAWFRMRSRCRNLNDNKYSIYGGRGIKICKRWDTFAYFVKDMGPHPGPGYSLDRKDVNGDYKPSNCRWATPPQQSQNRRTTKLSPEMVAAIRNTPLKFGVRASLARELEVSTSAVSRVILRHTWKDVA